MDTSFRLFPQRASSYAGEVDMLYFFLLMVAAFFTLLILVLIIWFSMKYRRRQGRIPTPIKTNLRLELTWSIIPLLLTVVMFTWGAKLYVRLGTPPPNAMTVNVVAKQWMWKIQHPEGRREINELHIPVGRPVRLEMISQDVIHSFYIPALRIKQDVVPGNRYSILWFIADTPGEYHLFCAEYCGAQHSGMIGRVVVMEGAAYQAWLAGSDREPATYLPDVPLATSGERLFQTFSCTTCHGQRAPTMAGLYGRRQQMADGTVVVAEESYLRESILNPGAKIVAGYPAIMPTFKGQLTEEQILELIAYIKSLAPAAASQPMEGLSR